MHRGDADVGCFDKETVTSNMSCIRGKYLLKENRYRKNNGRYPDKLDSFSKTVRLDAIFACVSHCNRTYVRICDKLGFMVNEHGMFDEFEKRRLNRLAAVYIQRLAEDRTFKVTVPAGAAGRYFLQLLKIERGRQMRVTGRYIPEIPFGQMTYEKEREDTSGSGGWPRDYGECDLDWSYYGG